MDKKEVIKYVGAAFGAALGAAGGYCLGETLGDFDSFYRCTVDGGMMTTIGVLGGLGGYHGLEWIINRLSDFSEPE